MKPKKTRHASYNINYHLVWCPKYRHKLFEDEALRQNVETVLRTVCVARGWELIEQSVQPDHLHLFVSAPPKFSPMFIVKVLKGASGAVLAKKLKSHRVWSRSYYVGTAGSVSKETIIKYIQEQEKED